LELPGGLTSLSGNPSAQNNISIPPDTLVWHQLTYNAGLSHVSLGEWNWAVSKIGNVNVIDRGSVYFVSGDRTPASEIPTSGTATYMAASLGFDTDAANSSIPSGASIAIALTADFGQRSMFAQLNRDGAFFGDYAGGYTSILAVDVHGTGPIASSGTFDIPLAGTVGSGNAITAVTGLLNGAFFGPNAQQVGGVFSVGQVPGVPIVSDAFVGTRN
jgi:hypothetical protein